MRAALTPWLLALVFGLACGARPATAPPERATKPAPEGASAPAPAAAADDPDEGAPCPLVDYATLEPPTGPPDPRTIALDRVFRRQEARPPTTAKAPTIHLGALPIPAPGPPPNHHNFVGIGWQGLEERWVAGTLRPELADPFAAWQATRRRYSEHIRGSYLLDNRARFARSVAPPPEWGARRCIERAAAEAAEAAKIAKADEEEAAATLRRALEGSSSLSAGEALLLAYLIDQVIPYPYQPADTARPIALLTRVVDDAQADREIRARAAERRAALVETTAPEFRASLTRALDLTRDPFLAIDTLKKLADTSVDPAEAERLRVELLARLDRRERPENPEDDRLDWLVAHTLADLAENRLARGAFALARADAARCARESATNIHRDPDPWGCAEPLAEAMATLAEAPAKTEVPLAFLGPLALESMESALARRDRDQARHVGALLLAEYPEAPEAPEVLVLLIALAPTADEARALDDRLARDYGPQSAWMAAQRARLAWDNEPERLEERIDALLPSAPRRHIPPPPTTPAEREADLRDRAVRTIGACTEALQGEGAAIELRVDTTGATPRAIVRAGARPSRGCLKREAEAHFRSVGPAQVVLRVAPRPRASDPR